MTGTPREPERMEILGDHLEGLSSGPFEKILCGEPYQAVFIGKCVLTLVFNSVILTCDFVSGNGMYQGPFCEELHGYLKPSKP